MCDMSQIEKKINIIFFSKNLKLTIIRKKEIETHFKTFIFIVENVYLKKKQNGKF